MCVCAFLTEQSRHTDKKAQWRGGRGTRGACRSHIAFNATIVQI